MEFKKDNTLTVYHSNLESQSAPNQEIHPNHQNQGAAPKAKLCSSKKRQQSAQLEESNELSNKDYSYDSETVDDVDARGIVQQKGIKQQNKRTQKAGAKQKKLDDSDANDGDDSAQEMEDSNIINVCGHIIDIEKITKEEIFKMRKILPKHEYRQLKNRKSARECRKKRKLERNGMMDELLQLRNDKIKLQAEVEVLSKQLQRLEENERQAIKQEQIQVVTSTSNNVAQMKENLNCSCPAQKYTLSCSETSIQAKIDKALSSKFESYFYNFEQKVTDLIQGELKKFTPQIQDIKSTGVLEDDVKQTVSFENLKPNKRGFESPQNQSVSGKLYQGQGFNDFENNQTHHDSNAASVYNQDAIDSNLMLGQFNQQNQIKSANQNTELVGYLRNILLTKFDKLQQTTLLKGLEQVKSNGQKHLLPSQIANPAKRQKVANNQIFPQSDQNQKVVDEFLVRLKKMHDSGEMANIQNYKQTLITSGVDAPISPVSSGPNSFKDLNIGKSFTQTACTRERTTGYRAANQSKIGPGVGHGGRR